MLYICILNIQRFDLCDLEEANEFRNSLIKWIKFKFNYELSFKLFKVAALFKTSKLDIWFNRSFKSIIYTNAEDNIKSVYYDSGFTTNKESENQNADNYSSQSDDDLTFEQCNTLLKRFGKY